MTAIVATCMPREIVERPGHAKPGRNGLQAVRAVELDVLARVEHVEATHPQPDGQAEQPRLGGGNRPAGRQPAAHRRHRHRQPEKRLRVGACSAWPASTRRRSPAPPATARGRSSSVARPRRQRSPRSRPRRRRRLVARSDRAGSRASRCAGFCPSYSASTRRLNPIAALRAATIATTIQPTWVPRRGLPARRQQRAGQRKRQREDRVAETDERQVGG